MPFLVAASILLDLRERNLAAQRDQEGDRVCGCVALSLCLVECGDATIALAREPLERLVLELRADRVVLGVLHESEPTRLSCVRRDAGYRVEIGGVDPLDA